MKIKRTLLTVKTLEGKQKEYEFKGSKFVYNILIYIWSKYVTCNIYDK